MNITRIAVAVAAMALCMGTVWAGPAGDPGGIGGINPGFAGPGIEGGGAPAPGPFAWNSAEYVFTAKIDKVDAGPVGMSFPPMYTHTLHMTVETVIRGPVKENEKVTCHHVARQEKEPTFPMGKVCLVAASRAQADMTALHVELADAAKVADVKALCSVPLGWKIDGGKPVSPWASMGKKGWAAEGADVAGLKPVCSKTGRPALMAGDKITFDATPVPPKQAIEWTNPDGDGEYTVTVANQSDDPVTVPALLSSGGKILWEESLVILCQDKAYMCPGAKGVSGKVEPTTLAPHQSVSAVVNVLRLKGPEWPQGGYRIEFQFCLGEKSKVRSLYYMSRHHDKLRDAAQKM
jgi:hypothetical protein